MDKTYHFLAGLPRSGNTLLSALLNQNPEIYSTPLSPLSTFLWDFYNSVNTDQHVLRSNENRIKSEIFLSAFMDNFYKEVEKPIVIDREKSWGTPANLELIKRYITPTPKIIFTVRNVLDIIASYGNINYNRLKIDTLNSERYHINYRSERDSIAEHIMRPNGGVDKALLSLASAFYPENKGMFHIVEYDDLVSNPNKTMAKIYDFLELPQYEHNFNSIQKVEVDDDESLGLSKNLHAVRKSLSKSPTSSDVLSDYIRHKYSNMEFWRDNSLMKIKGKDF